MTLTPLFSIARLTLIEAVRTRLPWTAAGIALVLVLVAEFAASLAITDSSSYRIGAYAALARLSMVFIVALFVASSVVRELQDRLLDLTLSRPVSRGSWYLGRLLGFAVAAVMLALVAAAPLFAFAPPASVAIWGASLGAELWLIAAASLTCVVTLGNVVYALTAVAAFYVLSRAIGAIVLMSSGPAVDPAAWSSVAIENIVAMIALLLPALDRYTQAAWLLPAAVEVRVLGEIAMQTAIYVAVLGAVGLFDFYRRDY